MTEMADVNPSTSLAKLGLDSSVSFIPMSDASESGRWIGRQTRKLRQVRSGYTPFQEGDILFAKITPCMENGKGCHAQGLVNGVGFGSTEFHVLRAKPDADARFVYHWLQSATLRLAAEAMMTGSAGQRRVPTEFFGRLPVPLLTLSEQRRIAEILDTADRAIGETEALIFKLKRMKTGLMHDLLTRGLDERGQLRDPDAHPEQFKDSPLGRIPRDWSMAPLEAVQNSERPYIKTGPFGSTLKGEHWVDEGTPVITIGALGEGKFLEDELLYITEEKAQSLAAYSVMSGDLVFSRVADVGRSVVVGADERNWIISSNLMRISLDRARILPKFAHLNLVHSDRTHEQVRRSVNAGGREVANTAILRSLRFVWPPLEEQHGIAEILDAHDARIRTEEAHRDKLRLQKKGLMEDLLTGRVRVKTAQEVGA